MLNVLVQLGIDKPAQGKGLTPKQLRFVAEYLIDLNATQAAIRAGYSAKTAASIGKQNLRKLEIAATISEAQAKRSERTAIDADWVPKRLVEEAVADLADIIDREQNLRKPVIVSAISQARSARLLRNVGVAKAINKA